MRTGASFGSFWEHSHILSWYSYSYQLLIWPFHISHLHISLPSNHCLCTSCEAEIKTTWHEHARHCQVVCTYGATHTIIHSFPHPSVTPTPKQHLPSHLTPQSPNDQPASPAPASASASATAPAPPPAPSASASPRRRSPARTQRPGREPRR